MTSTFQFNRLRGCSVAFGYLAVKRFLENNDLQCVIRAHAVQEDGYYRHFEKALKKRAVGEEGALEGGRVDRVNRRVRAGVAAEFQVIENMFQYALFVRKSFGGWDKGGCYEFMPHA